MRSIKNANLSMKYEWMKLQKFQIARKKGFNVVVRFQYSEISWDWNLICSKQLKIKKNLTPYQQFDKKCKKVQYFSTKWLNHLQLSQKSFKTWGVRSKTPNYPKYRDFILIFFIKYSFYIIFFYLFFFSLLCVLLLRSLLGLLDFT